MRNIFCICFDHTYRMPLSPITSVLFDKEYVLQEVPVTEKRIRDTHSDVSTTTAGKGGDSSSKPGSGTGGTGSSGDLAKCANNAG
jgi:hypothetical protein